MKHPAGRSTRVYGKVRSADAPGEMSGRWSLSEFRSGLVGTALLPGAPSTSGRIKFTGHPLIEVRPARYGLPHRDSRHKLSVSASFQSAKTRTSAGMAPYCRDVRVEQITRHRQWAFCVVCSTPKVIDVLRPHCTYCQGVPSFCRGPAVRALPHPTRRLPRLDEDGFGPAGNDGFSITFPFERTEKRGQPEIDSDLRAHLETSTKRLAETPWRIATPDKSDVQTHLFGS